MKLLDLFSGIGGFHLGLEQAGFEFDWTGYSETDNYANGVYEKHFTEAIKLGTVTNISKWDIPRPNIITFGSPCQDFSIAGKRTGLGGNRSSLIQSAIDGIKRWKPDIFIWENVKGTFSSNNGADFWAIIKAFADIGGYRLEWQLLNTAWFLPQNRERIYLVGHLGNRSGSEVFPIGEGYENNNETKQIANCLDASYSKGDNRPGNKSGRTLIEIADTGKNSQGYRVYSTKGISATLAGEAGGVGAKTGLYQVSPTIRAEHHNTADVHFVPEKSSIRRLTPTECERLQGFPDGWTEGQSDTQRYKVLGNAVSVPVVQAIGEKLRYD